MTCSISLHSIAFFCYASSPCNIRTNYPCYLPCKYVGLGLVYNSALSCLFEKAVIRMLRMLLVDCNSFWF